MNSTDSLWIIYAHTRVNDTNVKFSTLHTTVLFEGPSGSIIRLRGNGESYASSPSISYDGDIIEETQVLWTIDVMGKSSQRHVIQQIFLPTVVSLSSAFSPSRIVTFAFPSALPLPSVPANVVFLTPHGGRDNSPSAVS